MLQVENSTSKIAASYTAGLLEQKEVSAAIF